MKRISSEIVNANKCLPLTNQQTNRPAVNLLWRLENAKRNHRNNLTFTPFQPHTTRGMDSGWLTNGQTDISDGHLWQIYANKTHDYSHSWIPIPISIRIRIRILFMHIKWLKDDKKNVNIVFFLLLLWWWRKFRFWLNTIWIFSNHHLWRRKVVSLALALALRNPNQTTKIVADEVFFVAS